MKWGGAVVSVVLLVAWLGSGWYHVYWSPDGAWRFDAYSGAVILRPPGAIELNSMLQIGWQFEQRSTGMRFWLPRWWRAEQFVVLPLWTPATLLLMAAAVAWRLDTLARRRARIGFCPKCSYNRTGLAPGAVCPECGAAAPGLEGERR